MLAGTDSHRIRIRERSGSLVERARELLSAGPADAVALIAHVCQMPGAPRTVAEHMAHALFAGHPDFAIREGKYALREDVRLHVRQAPGEGESLRSLPWVVVDVETTGSGHRFGHRVTEFAAIVVDDGQIVRRYETLVNPGRPIPPRVSALTRITNEMVRSAPRFDEVRDEIAGVLAGRIFVAHNARFDWNFIRQEMTTAGGVVLEGPSLCTVRFARRALPQLRRRSLDALSQYYDIQNTARHRAGGDALATAELLLKLLPIAEDAGCLTWPDLERWLRRTREKKKRRSRLPTRAFGDEAA